MVIKFQLVEVSLLTWLPHDPVRARKCLAASTTSKPGFFCIELVVLWSFKFDEEIVMASDKSWTKLRNRNDPAFMNGLQKFMETAMNYLDSEGKMYCPCKKCVNFNRHDPTLVKDHIHGNGFLQSYNVWIYQGEKYPRSAVVESLLNPKNKTKTQSTTSEMFDVIHDVMAEHDMHEETIDVERARANPPEHPKYSVEEWGKLIDELFMNENYKRRCLINAQNRARRKYPSLGGSRSLAQQRHIQRQAIGKVSPLEIWYNTHTRNGQFVNNTAAIDWQNMMATFREMQQQSPDGTVDEEAILARVLGKARNWNRGQGPIPRNVPYDFRYNLPGQSSQSQIDQLNATLQAVQEQLQRQQAELDSLRQQRGSSSHSQSQNTTEYEDEDEDEYNDEDEN